MNRKTAFFLRALLDKNACRPESVTQEPRRVLQRGPTVSLRPAVRRVFTFQVHSSLKAFPEAARRAVLSSDLVDDAVVSPGTQVVVLACNVQRKEGEEEEREGVPVLSHRQPLRHLTCKAGLGSVVELNLQPTRISPNEQALGDSGKQSLRRAGERSDRGHLWWSDWSFSSGVLKTVGVFQIAGFCTSALKTVRKRSVELDRLHTLNQRHVADIPETTSPQSSQLCICTSVR